MSIASDQKQYEGRKSWEDNVAYLSVSLNPDNGETLRAFEVTRRSQRNVPPEKEGLPQAVITVRTVYDRGTGFSVGRDGVKTCFMFWRVSGSGQETPSHILGRGQPGLRQASRMTAGGG
ncbi:polyketide synthase [Aspergillus luchuensis]|uniref:Polyketide synthase n=1 Tax=Aspergillus kawachii TaxID=1069201 RepID=A0A146F987_ASPKA|nr:polyketide synthase [Aspergillus luchuensis]